MFRRTGLRFPRPTPTVPRPLPTQRQPQPVSPARLQPSKSLINREKPSSVIINHFIAISFNKVKTSPLFGIRGVLFWVLIA